MPGEWAFVASNGLGKPKKSDSALVRSVCMRGRNVRADSRRSKRRAKHERAIATPTPREQVQSSESADEDRVQPRPRKSQVLLPLESDLQTMFFAGVVDEWSRAILYKFLACGQGSSLIYPVDRHLNFHRPGDYLRWLASDLGCLHSILLSASAINDFAMRQEMSAVTYSHLRTSIRFLNEVLSDSGGYLKDSTLFLVLTLAITATMFAEHGVTKMHIRGLEEIVKLRGGYRFLKSFPKVHLKIERLDLSRCLSTGDSPMFNTGPISWEPFFEGTLPCSSLPTSNFGISIDHVAHPDLATTFRDLRYLTTLLANTTFASCPTSIDLYQQAIHSIQSRLLALRDQSEDDVQECLRLGMLALLTTTLRLPGKQMPYPYLSGQLRTHLQRARPHCHTSRHAVFWVLIMSIIAVFEIEEWMFKVWDRVAEREIEIRSGASWQVYKRKLEEVVWIWFVHDEPGQRACLNLSRWEIAVDKGHCRTLDEVALGSLRGRLVSI